MFETYQPYDHDLRVAVRPIQARRSGDRRLARA
jgi:hypothetical protein